MRSVWRPDHYVRIVTAIEPGWLVARGYGGLVSDLDNTLSGWHDANIPQPVRTWVAQVLAAGVGVCVLSNSMGRGRAETVEEMLGVPVLTRAFKPSGAGYRRALAFLGVEPGRAIAVGDQIRTDIVGAKRAGIAAVLVDRLTAREHWANAALRRLEERYLNRIGLFAVDSLRAFEPE